MCGISECLSREQRQPLGCDLDDAAALERADRHMIAGELAVGRVIRAERKKLIIGGIAHVSLRCLIRPHNRRFRAGVKPAPGGRSTDHNKQLHRR